MNVETNKKKCELRRIMLAVVKFSCLRGKTSTKSSKKLNLFVVMSVFESNAGVRIAQGIFGRERNS